jgi:hypothetical protein
VIKAAFDIEFHFRRILGVLFKIASQKRQGVMSWSAVQEATIPDCAACLNGSTHRGVRLFLRHLRAVLPGESY